MGALSPTHWVIIIGVLVLVFGARKLPDAARATGQSLRILSAETGELRGHPQDSTTTVEDAAPPTAGPPTATVVATDTHESSRQAATTDPS